MMAKAKQFLKKVIRLETYENMLISVLRFLMKRSPLRLFNKKYAQHHPYQSATTSLVTILAVFGIAGYFLFTNYFSQASAWWNDDWHYRKQLTINSAQVTADLTNFPILVSITDGDLASKAQADADDIVFTLSPAATKLDHEIESFDSSTGELVAWVKIPELDSDNDSSIYMYYGNPTTDNQQKATEVWDENFVMVQHLNEDPTGATPQMFDSTRNNNDGVSGGTMTSSDLAESKIGSGIDYDGSDDYVNTGSNAILNDLGPLSLSAWVYPRSAGEESEGAIITKGRNELGFWQLRFAGSGEEAYFTKDFDTVNLSVASNESLSEDTWQYLTITWDGTTEADNVHIYIDDSEATYSVQTDGQGSAVSDDSLSLNIGASSLERSWDGIIDEVHISNVERSDDWIETSFNNQNSPSTFLSISAEEQGPGPVLYLPFDEGFGTTAHDESSAHNDATITGASWATEDMCKTGKCLQFDGDDYLEIDDDNTLDLSNEMTMEAWVKPTTTNKTNQTIISKQETTDEPTNIYRSVGPSATTAITTGSSNEMTIAGTTAIFASSLPTNVGVGDAIQYDDDSDGDIDADDSIAFITGRISNTQYTITNAAGGTPTSVQADTDWSLFRAHTSLSNAEAGVENTGIDSDLRNFDDWTVGGDATTDDVGKDIATSNEQWNVACYANGTTADGTAVDIDGWTTDEESYIRVYTPTEFDEVGVSQRHSGVWDTSVYYLSLSTTYNDIIGIFDDYIRIDGLQIENTGSGALESAGVEYRGSGDVYFSNNIVKHNNATAPDHYEASGFLCHTVSTNERIFLWNNIFYDWYHGIRHDIFQTTRTDIILNNTIVDSLDYDMYIVGDHSAGYINNNITQGLSGAGYYIGSIDSPLEAFHNITEEDAQDGAFGATHTTGQADGTTASKLVDSGATFATDGVQVGSIVQDTSNTQYSYVTAIDSETILSVNDDYFVSGENYSVYTNKYGSVTFENEAGDDFRLDQTDTLAINQGTDLSADSNLAFVTDIEGDIRDLTATFDIGADEYVPTKIFRSVGPGSTDALEEGTDNPMTIVGNTATFTEALADNIGVGDAIQYDDDDDSDIDANDSIVFISGRISNSKFQITNSSGGLPTAVSQDTDWSLFRAYTTLDFAEDGVENTGIDFDLRSFDSGNRDIAANNEQWNFACYADAIDTSAEVEIAGWTTGFYNFIKIYTPKEENEVGESQRHNGSWNTDKYILDVAANFGIDVKDQHVKIEGIQFDSRDSDDASIELQNAYGAGDRTFLEVSSNIMWGNTGTYASATFMRETDLDYGYVYNNIAYDFLGSSAQGFYFNNESVSEIFVFNNSIFNSTHGIRLDTGNPGVTIKNNVAQDCDVDDSFVGTFGLSSSNNVTDDSAQDGAFGSTHSTGTTDGTTVSKLVDSTATFVTDGVQVGSIVVDTSNTQYSYVTAIDSETILSVNDDYFVSGENYSVYTNIFGAVDFVDEAGDDFHLDTIDNVALAQGADLSSDPNLPLTTDIDDDTREGSWSIGADEGTPTKIYRSVGPSNTTALTTGADNDMTISGNTAIFDEPLPDRVGVGDAIQYDDDSDGDIDVNDSIVFISGRTSSTEYIVKTAAGAAPTAVSADNDWSIFRAYISLANAEAGTENTGINSDLRNVDTFSTGRDLVTNGEQWNVACYADGVDSTNVTIDGWTTSEDNYIKMYTPYSSDEVGVRQRHTGVERTGYYLQPTTAGDYGLIDIQDAFVRIEGIELDGSASDNLGGYDSLGSRVGDSNGDVHIAHNLIHDNAANMCIYIRGAYKSGMTYYIYNNIVYDCFESGLYMGYEGHDDYVYNNTFKDNGFQSGTIYDEGITLRESVTGYVAIVNNLADGNDGEDFTGLYSANLAIFNASGDSSGNAGFQNLSFSFLDEANDDFRLAMSDTAAKGAGVNLYNDDNLPITTDITGEARPSPQDTITKKQDANGGMTPAFDVGADQISGIDHDNYSMSLYNDAPKVSSTDASFSTYEETIPANRWSHISYTRDSTNQYLYINGTQRQTDTIENFLWGNNGKLYIGSKDDSSNNSFQGFIDEIRIYPYARTAGEIKADRAAASSGRAVSRANEGLAASFGGGGDNFMSDGLVAYYKMEEGTSTTVTDYSGNGLDGLLTSAQTAGTAETASTTTTIVDADNADLITTDDAYNGMTVEITGGSCGITVGTTEVISDYDGTTKTITVGTAFGSETDTCTFELVHSETGKFGGGLDFDGVDDKIEVVHPTAFDLSDFTYSIWVNKRAASGWRTLMDINNDGQAMVFSSDTIYIYGRCGASASTTVASDSGWHHLVWTVKGSDYVVYKDGEQVDSGSGCSESIDGSVLNFGKWTTAQWLNATIDEARVYNRALGAREVKELYEWAPGPVMHLKMDEKVAGDAQTLYDTSGNENNGTTVDGANDTGMDCTKPGKYGSSCEFDGTDDYVFIDDASSISFPADSNFTFSAWAKIINCQASESKILEKKQSNSETIAIVCKDTGVAEFSVRDSNDNSASPDGTSLINDDIWHYLTGVKEGNDVYTYVDGVQENSLTDSFTGNWDDGDVRIGTSIDGGARFTEGLIDDVKVYNYARTGDQIIEDMNAGHPAGGSPVGSPVAYWKFNEGFGDTAYDELGNSDGTLEASTGGSQTTETEMWELDGKFDKAIEFDGTDDHVDVGDPSSGTLDMGLSDWSVSTWIKPYSSGAFDDQIVNKKINFSDGYDIRYDHGSDVVYARIDESNLSTNSAANSVPTDVWSHVLVTFDRDEDMTTYINGEASGTPTDISSVSGATQSNTTAFSVGCRNGGSCDKFFDGLIDEVKIYNYAMTGDQAKTEFNMGKAQVMGQDPSRDNDGTAVTGAAKKYCIPGDDSPCDGPVLALDFDEKSGTTAYDTSGNGNDGTLGGGTAQYEPTWSDYGKIGAALKFDGSDDYVQFNSPTDLDDIESQGGGGMTASFWINPDSNTNSIIMGKGRAQNSTGSWTIGKSNQTDPARLNFWKDGATDLQFSLNDVFTSGVWQNITLTWDGTMIRSGVSVYRNGKYMVYGGGGADGATANSDAVQDFVIGEDDVLANPFDGLIDDVKVYNYVRTPAQIAWDYNKGKPIAHWKLDESSGATAHDASGFGNDGTLTNMEPATDWTTGRNQGALDFGGNTDTDYVRISDDDIFTTDALSVSAWVKFDDTGTTKAIVSKWDYSANIEWHFSRRSNDDFLFGISTNSTNGLNVLSDISPTTDVWYHVVATWDGGFDIANGKIYINGIEDTSGSSYETGSFSGLTNTAQDVLIGNQYSSGVISTTRYFDGIIDDVKIWNYALTAEQVKEVNNSGAVSFQ